MTVIIQKICKECMGCVWNMFLCTYANKSLCKSWRLSIVGITGKLLNDICDYVDILVMKIMLTIIEKVKGCLNRYIEKISFLINKDLIMISYRKD